MSDISARQAVAVMRALSRAHAAAATAEAARPLLAGMLTLFSTAEPLTDTEAADVRLMVDALVRAGRES